jgi:quinol monooxygenase YgiN
MLVLKSLRQEVIAMISRSETEIAVIAQFTAKKGKADELVGALHHAIGLGLHEPGCRRLILYQCVENPRICTVIEKFADQKAFEAHLAAAYTVDLLQNIIPRLARKQSITSHKEVSVPKAEVPAAESR